MNHCVPEFDTEEGHTIPSSSGLSRQKNKQEDEIMELLWQNGQVVVHTQNQQRFHRKWSPHHSSRSHHQQPLASQQPPDSTPFFIQEDEMASWLHYTLDDPSFDRDLYADFLYQPPAPPTAAAAAAPTRTAVEVRPIPPDPTQPHPQVAEAAASAEAAATQPPPLPPPPPPPVAAAAAAAVGVNFPHFSRMRTSRFLESGPSTSTNQYRRHEARERELTVADSSDNPNMAGISMSRVSQQMTRSVIEVTGGEWSFGGRDVISGGGGGGTGRGGCCQRLSREGETCDLTMTSSPGGSGASASATASADMANLPASDDRKRKGRQEAGADAAADCNDEDVEIESNEAKKQSRGSTTAKRSRAAEVHNLSERRRRDRINEKMRALKELIPRCSKTDKASVLDEAIEYLKSLQLQVQMMSMGCGVIPMMFSGVQQYMPAMGLEMGMNRPMMHFPAVLSSSALPTPGVASHLGPRFQLPAFPMPPPPDMSRIQATGQADLAANPLGFPGQPSLAGIPNLADAYQPYLGIQQMPLQIPQNQPTSQPSTRKASTSRGSDIKENPPNG